MHNKFHPKSRATGLFYELKMHFQDKAFRHHDDAFSSGNVGEHEVFAIASRKENVIFLSLPKRSKQTVLCF